MSSELQEGASLPVLAHPDSDVCAIFGSRELVAARVRRPSSLRAKAAKFLVALLLLLFCPLIARESLERRVVDCDQGDCEYREEVLGRVLKRIDYPTRFIAATMRKRNMMKHDNKFVPHYGLLFTLPDGSTFIGRPWFLDPEEPTLTALLKETRQAKPDFVFRSPFGAWHAFWALFGVVGFFFGGRLLVTTVRR